VLFGILSQEVPVLHVSRPAVRGILIGMSKLSMLASFCTLSKKHLFGDVFCQTCLSAQGLALPGSLNFELRRAAFLPTFGN